MLKRTHCPCTNPLSKYYSYIILLLHVQLHWMIITEFKQDDEVQRQEH